MSSAIASTGAFVYPYPLAALAGVALVLVDVVHNEFGVRTKAVGALCAAVCLLVIVGRLERESIILRPGPR